MKKAFEKAIMEIVSEKTGIPIERIKINAGEGNLMALEEALKSRIVGQEDAKNEVLEHLRAKRVERDLYKPIGSFLFTGPSGVGKTEFAKTIAKDYFGDEKRIVRINCSEYKELHTVSTLLGAPPGYVGYSEGGVLTEGVKKNPFSLVLFDEIEKAHPDIYPLLLQITDEGSLTDRSGFKTDFRHTIVVLTSNIGNMKDDERMGLRKDQLNSTDDKKRFIQAAKNYFSPEFIGRLSKIIVFQRLTPENIDKLFDMEITALEKGIGIEISITDLARKVLVKEAYSQDEGARRVKKTVRSFINAGISRMNVDKGKKISIDIDDDGDLVFEMITT